MSKPVVFQNSKVVPDDVYAATGASHYEIDISGFESGLLSLTVANFDRMIVVAGSSFIDHLTTPVLDLSSTPHTISWQMREKGVGDVAADIWFELSDSEPIALSWRLRITR